MKKTVFIILFSFIYFYANAQMGLLGKKPAAQVELLKERSLLVVLWDEGELDLYNENIKKAIEEVWTFSTDIRYISKDEWRKLAKDKDEAKKYAHLYYTAKTLNANAPEHSLVLGILEKKISTNFHYTDLGLADLILALKNIQSDLEMGADYKKMIKSNEEKGMKFLSDSIEHKTLYINKDLVSKKFLKKIDEIYTYKYKLVTKDDIDEAIINKNPNVLFIKEFVRAQRPMTKTRENIRTTASMYVGLNLVYKASDLKYVAIAGTSSMGSLDGRPRETGKIKIKGIKMLLKYIK